MHPLRLAYTTQFLIASIAVYFVWSQVGGQSHLDLMQWYVKFGLGLGAAFAIVKATAAAVDSPNTWNGRTVKWTGILLALLACCALASFYAHTYEEENADEEDQNVSELLIRPRMMTRMMNGYEASVVPSADGQRICADVRRLPGA
jgi:hypothetical protein